MRRQDYGQRKRGYKDQVGKTGKEDTENGGIVGEREGNIQTASGCGTAGSVQEDNGSVFEEQAQHGRGYRIPEGKGGSVIREGGCQMTEKEMAALDKKMKALSQKISKTKNEYDSLVDQLSALIEQRYPERREEAMKNRLYEPYKKSGKTVDFIIDFIENAPDDDDYWA